MKLVTKCPVCNQSNTRTVCVNNAFSYPSDILECRTCQFCWLEKQLDDNELNLFYQIAYRADKAEQFDKVRQIGDLVRSRSQYRFFRKYIQKKNKILEIGSGYGVLANHLFQSGFRDITVIDFDWNSIALNLNSEIKRYEGQLTNITESRYDFIIMSHVFEHFSDIESKIAKLKNLLPQGGIVFIEVPNNQNMIIKKQMSKNYHYLFFTQQNLSDLFRKSHFEIIEKKCFGKIKLLSDYSKDDFSEYEKMVLHDKQFEDIVEMGENDKNAFWIRMLLKK